MVKLRTHCITIHNIIKVTCWTGRQSLFRVHLDTSSGFTGCNGCMATFGLQDVSNHGAFKEVLINFLLMG